jgi:hydroxymethylbilane synthase
VPLAKVGGKGLFVKEIEEALQAGRMDMAVHSMKDMPAELPEGLAIGAVPERESPVDVLISRDGERPAALAPGSIIGTSSLRRAAQLRASAAGPADSAPAGQSGHPAAQAGETDNLAAVVLAAAGVHRLGLADRISEHLDPQSSCCRPSARARCASKSAGKIPHSPDGRRPRPSGHPCGGQRRARVSETPGGRLPGADRRPRHG